MWYKLDDARSDAFREGWVMDQEGFITFAVKTEKGFEQKTTKWKIESVRVWL